MMRRSRAFYLAWLPLAVTVVFVGIEAGARTWVRFRGSALVTGVRIDFDRVRPSAIPGLEHELVPGAQNSETNEHGFRGPSFPAIKPRDELRVFVVGDSVVYGNGLRVPETISSRLEEHLRAAALACHERVVNAGVFGYNIENYLAVIRHRLPPFSPDAVVIVLGGNDLQPPGLLLVRSTWQRAFARRSFAFRLLLAEQFRRRQERVLAEPWRARNLAALEEIMRPAWPGDPFRLVALLPPLEDDPGPEYERIAREFRRLAARHGVRLLELADALRGHFGTLTGIGVSGQDRTHPGAEAADVVARAIAARLLEMGLREAARQRCAGAAAEG